MDRGDPKLSSGNYKVWSDFLEKTKKFQLPLSLSEYCTQQVSLTHTEQSMQRCDTPSGFRGWYSVGFCWGSAKDLNRCDLIKTMLHRQWNNLVLAFSEKF